MTIFSRIDAMQGHVHDELLAIIREIAVMAGADVAVPPTLVPSEPYTLQTTDAPVAALDGVELFADPSEPAVSGEVMAVEVVAIEVAAPQAMEAPAVAAVGEPTITVTEA